MSETPCSRDGPDGRRREAPVPPPGPGGLGSGWLPRGAGGAAQIHRGRGVGRTMGEAPAGRRVTPVCTGPPHARGRAHARTHGPPWPLLLSAGAWIVTGGSHTGVMKQVGKAVRDSSLSSGHDDGDVVTIGIATWGVVHNREGLVHPEVSRVAAPGLPRGGLAPRGVPRVPRWQVTPRRRGRGGSACGGEGPARDSSACPTGAWRPGTRSCPAGLVSSATATGHVRVMREPALSC